MGEPTSQRIYQDLRTAILNGVYGQNQFLIEREIAENCGVSRAPVRDALRQLCQEGYLIAYPRKGYLVNCVNGDYLYQTQQVRFQLESLALALVIQTASDEALERFSLTVPTASPTNPYHTENTQFHMAMAKLSGNDVLAESIYHHLGNCSLAVFQHPDLMHDYSNFHAQILESVRNRDFLRAQEFLGQDLQLSGWRPFQTYLPL